MRRDRPEGCLPHAVAGSLVGMDIRQGRWTAQVDGDFVVFLIGAAVHDPDLAPQVGSLLTAMLAMLAELEQDPSHGLLGYETHGSGSGLIVQYWRSFDALERYARNPAAHHAPVWRAWNRLAVDDRAGAGIWHETFLVAARNYEAVYQNMPVMGLAKAGRALSVEAAQDSARRRLGG